MTKNRKNKQAARALGAATGQSYTSARRQLAGAPPYEIPSHDDLVAANLSGACEDRLGEEVTSVFGVLGGAGAGGGVLLLDGMRVAEATIERLEINDAAVSVFEVETFEGGATASNAQAEAELFVQGVMAKGDAIASEASGLVEIIEPDLNRHDSLVAVVRGVPVELDFEAVVTSDTESVEDLRLVGGSLLL
ncbi:MAG: hypothetical protein WD794_13225 [Mycobacteriales bacterium]